MAERALKSFLHWLSQQWNVFLRWLSQRRDSFCVCWNYFKTGFELGYNIPYAERTQNFGTCWLSKRKNRVTLWLSICKNWLLVGWACAIIGYSLARSIRKNHYGTHIRAQIKPIFEKLTRNRSNNTKMNISQKNSNFRQKAKENNRNIFG